MKIGDSRSAESNDGYTDLSRLSDDTLMGAVQRGNGDAFAVIFDRYHRLVLVTAARIIRDAGEAEDVTQQIFLEIYRAAGQFDSSRGTLRVWVLQYAYHRSISRRNYLSLRRFYDQASLDEAAFTAPVYPPTQEIARIITEGLALLNDAQRSVLQMVFFEGLTFKDIAEHSGQTFSAVRHHYYRGLASLRAALEGGNKSDARSVMSFAEAPHVEA